jgi:two-component system alkaline phosphatase synthesis response regulator PhoP
MAKKILVVDDSAQMRTMLVTFLTRQLFEVVTAGDGQEALLVARREKPDLVILDLMMPKMDGYEFLRIFSREAITPVIILTAKIEEIDKLLGLELGADDYITKPFSMHELAARIRAVLRRVEKQSSGQGQVLRRGEISVDQPKRIVTVNTRRVDLTPTEFDILVVLMSEPGRVFSRPELLDRLQGGLSYEGFERMINVHISNLRNKIEPDPSAPRYIETVYGAGYRFAA